MELENVWKTPCKSGGFGRLAGTDSKGTSEPSAPLGIRAVVPSSAAQLCGRGSAVQRCFLADILVLVSDAALGSVAGEAVFAGNAAVLAVLNLVCAVKSWKVHASVRAENEVSAPEGHYNENVPKN